ncbi:uncharacterized protein LOC144713520 [Wolffia australiana]
MASITINGLIISDSSSAFMGIDSIYLTLHRRQLIQGVTIGSPKMKSFKLLGHRQGDVGQATTVVWGERQHWAHDEYLHRHAQTPWDVLKLAEHVSHLDEVRESAGPISANQLGAQRESKVSRRTIRYAIRGVHRSHFSKSRKGSVLNGETPPTLEETFNVVRRIAPITSSTTTTTKAAALSVTGSGRGAPFERGRGHDRNRGRPPLPPCEHCGKNNHRSTKCYAKFGYPADYPYPLPPGGFFSNSVASSSSTSTSKPVMMTQVTAHLAATAPTPDVRAFSVTSKGVAKPNANLHLENVLYVPNLSANLLSISAITKELFCSVQFFPYHCIFQDLHTGRRIGLGRDTGRGIYELASDTPSA